MNTPPIEDSIEDQVKQFMESMGFEETMLGNYSGHEEMIGYDAALLFYQELKKARKESGTKMALVFLELLKQNDLLSGLGEGVLEELYERAGLQTKEPKEDV